MSANLMSSLAELSGLKQLKKEELEEIIQNSLYQAISKKLTSDNELEIIADFNSNRVYAKFYKIVSEIDEGLGEISLEDAIRNFDENAKLGDKFLIEMSIQEFEPKVIRNARKAILERIKLLEEDRIMDDYENQKNQIISGKVRKNDFNGYIIDIGYTDALLPIEEQVDDEYYKPGDIVRAFVVNIRKRKNDVVVILLADIVFGFSSNDQYPNSLFLCFVFFVILYTFYHHIF
jgi:N utilization substance protein A